jgi:hypothetical protein
LDTPPDMIIRQAQMDAMSESFNDDYIKRIMPSLKEDYPEECAALGDEDLRDLARYGMDRSESYRITTEVNVYCYIAMMLLFGRDFDTDPDYLWASDILNDCEFNGEDEKTDSLCNAASEYLNKIG